MTSVTAHVIAGAGQRLPRAESEQFRASGLPGVTCTGTGATPAPTRSTIQPTGGSGTPAATS